MIEQLEPPSDSQEQTFLPVLTQEVLACPEVQLREEVLADRQSDGEEEGATSEIALPACLEVESVTRRAHRRVRLLMVVLALVTLGQFIVYLGIRYRRPIRVYEAAPLEYLVQP